jgi:hypothetical protein
MIRSPCRAARAMTFGPLAATSTGTLRLFGPIQPMALEGGASASSSSDIGGATVVGMSMSSNGTDPPFR